MQPHTVKNLRMRRDLIMRRDRAIEHGVDVENSRNASDARQNAILLSQDRRRSALVGIDAGITRRIARSPVFEQRILNNRRKPS